MQLPVLHRGALLIGLESSLERNVTLNLMVLVGMPVCVVPTSVKWVMCHAVDVIMPEVMSQPFQIL